MARKTSLNKVVVASAPGRIDFLGGVADYSGSLVLQMPIKRVTRVRLAPAVEAVLRVRSVQEGAFECALPPASVLARDGASARAWLDEVRAPGWARYSLGCLILHARRFGWRPRAGLEMAIDSEVPASMGVSSSAALEVATLRALELYSGKRYKGTELARTAQKAENEIVGAPCGLMDQLASAHGLPGALLPILCRPDGLGEPVRLPAGFVAVGWPSGVKHAVGASPYATARAAAFMGRRLAEEALGRKVAHATEFAPSELRGLGEDALPWTVTGAEFLKREGGVDDPLSQIAAERVYPVRAGVLFPVEEHFRARTAERLLRSVGGKKEAEAEEAATLLGELMYQSHAGYSSIGLGCPETDEMVAAVRALGPKKGFYGARVSGGGSGGTVVVLLKAAALPRLKALAKKIVFSADGPLPVIA